MKYTIFSCLLLSYSLCFVACDDTEEGCEPGGDSNANMVVWQSEVVAAESMTYRVSVNSATSSVYYLDDDAATAHDALDKDKAAYAQHVLEAGTKLDSYNGGADDFNFTVNCQKGRRTISLVCTGKGEPRIESYDLNVPDWEDITTGYYFSNVYYETYSDIPATLQRDKVVEGRFRIQGITFGNDVFNLILDPLLDEEGMPVSDEFGDHFLRIQANTVCVDADYGQVLIRDVAAWQGDETYALPDRPYASYLNEQPDDKGSYASLCVQYYCADGGFGYQRDRFDTPEAKTAWEEEQAKNEEEAQQGDGSQDGDNGDDAGDAQGGDDGTAQGGNADAAQGGDDDTSQGGDDDTSQGGAE